MLSLMDIPIPEEMTGSILLQAGDDSRMAASQG